MPGPFDFGQRILLDQVCGLAERDYLQAENVNAVTRDLFKVLLSEAQIFLVPPTMRSLYHEGKMAVEWEGERIPINLRAPLTFGTVAVQDDKSLVLVSDLESDGRKKAFLECHLLQKHDSEGQVIRSIVLSKREYEDEVFVVRWGVMDMTSELKGRLHLFQYSHISKRGGVLNSFHKKLTSRDYETIAQNIKMGISQAQAAVHPWREGLLVRMDPKKIRHAGGPKFLRSSERRRYTLIPNSEIESLPGYPRDRGRAGYVVNKVTKTYRHPRYKNVRGQCRSYKGYVVPSTEPTVWECGGSVFTVASRSVVDEAIGSSEAKDGAPSMGE